VSNKTIRLQVSILFFLILANFLAQIPYFLHLYYNPHNPLADVRGILLMLLVFGVFLLASILLFTRRATGYWLMLLFVAVDFLFYLWNTVGAVIHGYGLFFQLNNADLLLRVIFAIGYVNLFASGYFLGLLLIGRDYFLRTRDRAHPLPHYSV
jgi:hypothetical protein